MASKGSFTDVPGGYGVTGMKFSGKGNVEKPSRNMTVVGKTTMANPIGRRYAEALGPMKPKNVPRTFVPGPRKPAVLPPAIAIAPVPVRKPTVKPTAQVISNVVREKPSPAPARMAVNARTGNTTGFTTGKTTGTTASKPGVAGKTAQSAYSRQMANAMNRTNQPAGSMGGGGGRMGGGTGPSRPSGGGSLGGARGRIGEPAGSKR